MFPTYLILSYSHEWHSGVTGRIWQKDHLSTLVADRPLLFPVHLLHVGKDGIHAAQQNSLAGRMLADRKIFVDEGISSFTDLARACHDLNESARLVKATGKSGELRALVAHYDELLNKMSNFNRKNLPSKPEASSNMK